MVARLLLQKSSSVIYRLDYYDVLISTNDYTTDLVVVAASIRVLLQMKHLNIKCP